ncbi:MAG: hypothetical protein WCW01_03655 [Gammaproteobacteria bacterium]
MYTPNERSPEYLTGSFAAALCDLAFDAVESFELAPICKWRIAPGERSTDAHLLSESQSQIPESELTKKDVSKALVAVRGSRWLRILKLSHVTLDQDVCIWLANILKYTTSLVELDVSNTKLDAKGAMMLLDAIKQNPDSNLVRINLNGNYLGLYLRNSFESELRKKGGNLVPENGSMQAESSTTTSGASSSTGATAANFQDVPIELKERLANLIRKVAEYHLLVRMSDGSVFPETEKIMQSIESLLEQDRRLLAVPIPNRISCIGEQNILLQSAQCAPEILKLVLDRLSNEEFHEMELDGIPLFCLAASKLGIEGARLIKERFSEKQRYLDNALWYSLYRRDIKVADICSDLGANISKADCFGRLPLHYAVSYLDKSMIRFLCSKGANINAPMGEKGTCLHMLMDIVESVTESDKMLMAKMLIDLGASTESLNGEGKRPDEVAEASGFRQLAQLIKEVRQVRGITSAQPQATTSSIVTGPRFFGGGSSSAAIPVSQPAPLPASPGYPSSSSAASSKFK